MQGFSGLSHPAGVRKPSTTSPSAPLSVRVRIRVRVDGTWMALSVLGLGLGLGWMVHGWLPVLSGMTSSATVAPKGRIVAEIPEARIVT